MRDSICIYCSPEDRARLERLVADRNTPRKVVWRAEIVLATAEGLGTMAVMRRTGKSKPCVWRWQERFVAEGVGGLLRDKTRPSRKKPLTAEVKLKVLTKTANETPANATHWSLRSMAKETGISRTSVQRIWAEAGLKPHLLRKFKVSNDPKFVEKVSDVVGLYLNPPDKARVLCVAIVLGKIVMDGSLQFGHACEDTPADALASDFCKEALNQIQPGRRCWNEMQFETRMLRKPGLDLFGLMGRIVVRDQMQVEVLGNGPVDFLQETDELLGPVPRQAFADDLPGLHIQGGEQCRGAVALIIMRHRRGPALLHRQAWLRAIERLDLTLLIDAQHQCFVRRVQVEPDDIANLLHEFRVVRDLEFA
jgi:transposase